MRILSPAVVGMVVMLSCSSITDSCGCSPVPQPYGTWVATRFVVTPAGQAPIDVLAAGGSLTITIAPNFTTSGALTIPASVNRGVPFTASMDGTASYTSSAARITFTQAADTFVRDLTWNYTVSDLSVTNQTAGNASYTVTLTRQ